MFSRADDEWTCEVCMITNKLTAAQCLACAAAPPGAKPGKHVMMCFAIQ